MISWKQRVYAFLLRRLLGPYLTTDSLQKLHACLDVSLQEGTYVLKDVGLNAEYLSSILVSGVRLRTVTIRRLEIRLSLQEHTTSTTNTSSPTGLAPESEHDRVGPDNQKANNITNEIIDSSSNSSSSLAWRAFQLGSGTSVSLVARIEVEGVLVELEACSRNNFQQQQQQQPGPSSSHCASSSAAHDETAKTAATDPPSTKSYLSSYLDAALASLRLSIQMSDVRFRVYGTSRRWTASSATNNECWLETQVQSVSYRDAISETAESIVSKNTEYRTVLHKTIEWTRLTITTGTAANNPQSIALLDGTSRVTLRVIEYNLQHQQQQQEKHIVVRTQNDLHVSLDQKLNVAVDAITLSYIKNIVQSFLQQPAEESDASSACKGGSLPEPMFSGSIDESADYQTMDGIRKQYQEARILAERNLFRGGILFPADDDENFDGVTFDTFFDANEHSMSRYSTVLKESILGGRELSSNSSIAPDWIHTKFRFDLREGGVKLAFLPFDQQSRNSGRDEYVLLTFGDVCLASSLRARSSEHSFSISCMKLEEAMLVASDVDSGTDDASGALQLIEIGSLVRFVSKDLSDDESDCGILVQSPCISLVVKNESTGTENGQEAKDSTDLELTLESIECCYRHRTMSKLSRIFATGITDAIDCPKLSGCPAASVDNKVPHSKSLTMSLYTPSVDISLPIMADGAGWSKLYERCGYTTTSAAARKSALGVTFEEVLLNIQLESAQLRKHDASLSCRNLVAYAISPKDISVFGRKVHRLDLFALGGRTEVEPCIPITAKLSDYSHSTGTVATGLFPKAPSLSSFKARQQDEDEDDRIDRMLSAEHCDLDVGGRKELREVDVQSMMLSDVAKSEISISLHIPELVGDLSISEVLVLQSMVDNLTGYCNQARVSNYGIQPTADDHPKQLKRTAMFLVVDFVSLSVHGNCEKGVFSNPSPSFSFMTKMDTFKAHSLTDGTNLRHLRVMAHELDFFEVSNLSLSSISESVPDSMEARVSLLNERQMCHGDSAATPIIYRFHLFSPISRSSPAILVDLLNADSGDEFLVQRNVYCTLYDTTYRIDYDSKWMERVSSILRREKPNHGNDISATKEEGRPADKAHSLTRVFCSVADCNLDYSSSPRFRTASRTIFRIGDFRLSSNIMSPCVSAQAFSISLGDISLYLCNSRYPYNFENSLLPRVDTVLRPHQYHLSIFQNAVPEAVQQAMNYRTVFSVDSVDGIAAISNGKTNEGSVPDRCLSLTVGQVSVFLCKDSFQILQQTIGQAAAELTALDDDALDALKLKSIESEHVAVAAKENRAGEKHDNNFGKDLQQQRITRPAFGTSMTDDLHLDFLLDGYDWTTIDLECSGKCPIPEGEEYSAGWFPTGTQSEKATALKTRIVPDHFRRRPIADPLGDGDMGISKLIAPGAKYHVQTRALLHNLSLRLRLLDGYDWPEQLSSKEREVLRGDDFVIPEVPIGNEEGELDAAGSGCADLRRDEKSKLMCDLLSGGIEHGDTFRDVPLPEEKGKSLRDQEEFHRLARRTNKYFQITFSGVSLRLDSLEESKEHRLASCLSFKAQDFFVAETISSDRAVKMVGEWFNEDEHPRDSNDGLLMMKMISWHPKCRVTVENDIVNDENEVILHVLPLRCIVDQRAVAFVRAFFYSKQEHELEDVLPPGLHSIPPPLFSKFVVRPLKLKVDYKPQKLDTRALRDGAVVELVNLSPIDGMILTVKQVEVENELGFGNALSIVVGGWVRYICATQLYKFVANMRPFEAITGVSATAVDMVVLPWEAFQNGESIQKALRSGTINFSKALVYEFLTMTSRAAEFFAGNVSRASSSHHLSTGIATPDGDLLPSRPLTIPRGFTDARSHAVESLSRGFQAANYKVVIVPFLEYQRTGASGAVKKVLRGIPVAIAAPACGAAEALSFALLGARNSLRPDIRKEEEASLRGLQHLGDF